jgi:hypothetical protein
MLITKKQANPIDKIYDNLKCEIKTVEHSSNIFKNIDTYITNTSDYYKIKVEDMYELKREGEKESYNPHGYKNKKMLFHGSRFSNFTGIIGKGLRIAPKEAPSTGYNFGKGVYLADMAGKSAPYCCPYLSNNTILLIICETALGNPRELQRPDYNAANLPKGSNSTFAVGRQRPTPSGSIMFEKNIEIPVGKVENFSSGGMGHNEYIVYNTNQVRMRYLVRCKLN